MIQNVKITSILTTFILLMIKDRNIGFWRICSTSKTEKIPVYLKLVKLVWYENAKNVFKMAILNVR